MRRPVMLIVTALALTGLTDRLAAVPGHTVAQGATPAASPVVPAPDACRVTPRSVASLVALSGTPAATAATATTGATPFSLPPGRPADAQTVAGVTATIRELVACFNANDYLRAFALYTDGYLRRLFAGQGGLKQSDLDFFATPPAPVAEKDRTAIVALQDFRVLADGRAAVTVVGADPTNPAPAASAVFFLTKAGGGWLIDEVVRLGADATPAP